jgi:hypothetical protein
MPARRVRLRQAGGSLMIAPVKETSLAKESRLGMRPWARRIDRGPVS